MSTKNAPDKEPAAKPLAHDIDPEFLIHNGRMLKCVFARQSYWVRGVVRCWFSCLLTMLTISDSFIGKLQKKDDDMSNTRYPLDTLKPNVGHVGGLVTHRSSVSALRSGIISRYSVEKPGGGVVESSAARRSSAISSKGAVSMRRAGVGLEAGTVESNAALCSSTTALRAEAVKKYSVGEARGGPLQSVAAIAMSRTEIAVNQSTRISSGGLIEGWGAVSFRHTEVAAYRSVCRTADGAIGIQETLYARRTEIKSQSSTRRTVGIDTSYKGAVLGRHNAVATKRSIALGAVGGLVNH